MVAIRVIFDGKAFQPQQPVSLPAQSNATVLVDETDDAAQQQLDAAVREYYRGVPGGADADDDAWAKAALRQSHEAWDED